MQLRLRIPPVPLTPLIFAQIVVGTEVLVVKFMFEYGPEPVAAALLIHNPVPNM